MKARAYLLPVASIRKKDRLATRRFQSNCNIVALAVASLNEGWSTPLNDKPPQRTLVRPTTRSYHDRGPCARKYSAPEKTMRVNP